MADGLMTDDEQLENVKRWLAVNGPWLAGGMVVAAVLVVGWRYYESQKSQQAVGAAARFDALSQAMDKNEASKAHGLAASLQKDFGASPYADQADLMEAKLAVDAGLLDKAVAPLTHVMNSSRDEELRHVARLRLARVLIAQKKASNALTLLGAASSRAFAARYRELRGDAYYAMNDKPNALKEYQAALADPEGQGLERGFLEAKITDLGGALPSFDASAPLARAAAK